MNTTGKLRKTTSPSSTFGRSTSRTMQLAKDLSISLKSTTSRANDGPIQHHTRRTQPVVAHETSVTTSKSKELQYWTMRAHSAEAQLQLALSKSRGQQAQHVHVHTGVSYNSLTPDVAGRQDNNRIIQLEWVVIILLVFISILSLVVVYLYASRTTPRNVPAHFTIPILSPFTSVVEHETSVIGSKTIALILLILGALSYLAIRLRLGR